MLQASETNLLLNFRVWLSHDILGEARGRGPINRGNTWPANTCSPGSCSKANTHEARRAAVPIQLPLVRLCVLDRLGEFSAC